MSITHMFILLILAIDKKYLIIFFIVIKLYIIFYKNKFFYQFIIDN